MKKRFIAFILATLLIFNCCNFKPIQAAQIDEFSDKQTYINPIYKDVISAESLSVGELTNRKQKSQLNAKSLSEDLPICDTQEEILAHIRNSVKNRETVVEVGYRFNNEEGSLEDGFMERLTASVFEHTGDPEEGDYIRWHLAGYTSYNEIYETENGMLRICFLSLLILQPENRKRN